MENTSKASTFSVIVLAVGKSKARDERRGSGGDAEVAEKAKNENGFKTR
jgi:hypothetical protein